MSGFLGRQRLLYTATRAEQHNTFPIFIYYHVLLLMEKKPKTVKIEAVKISIFLMNKDFFKALFGAIYFVCFNYYFPSPPPKKKK